MANTAFDHAPTITVPSPTVNNRVVTWNGTTGKVFHNAATVTIAAGVVAGVTALTVDDITVDGTSITTIASNNSINITPHGTGSVVISKVDINDGAIDGTAIGAASASTVAGTTLSASTSLKTPLIEYTDGDDAITIADGGGITVAQNAIFTGTIRTPSILVKGTSNSVTLDADNPAAYTIILPNAAPTAAGKLLQSSGSSPYSTLEWGDAAGGGAITYEGGNTDGSGTEYQNSAETEATTTSVSLVDLLIVSGLGIGATVPIRTKNLYRKTAGAAERAGFIIRKINTTAISTDVGNDANNNVPATAGGGTNSNRAEAGYAITNIRPIITSYTYGSVQGEYAYSTSIGGHGNVVRTRPAGTTANKPDATVASITIGCQLASASITGGADEFHVYSYAIS